MGAATKSLTRTENDGVGRILAERQDQHLSFLASFFWGLGNDLERANIFDTSKKERLLNAGDAGRANSQGLAAWRLRQGAVAEVGRGAPLDAPTSSRGRPSARRDDADQDHRAGDGLAGRRLKPQGPGRTISIYFPNQRLYAIVEGIRHPRSRRELPSSQGRRRQGKRSTDELSA